MVQFFVKRPHAVDQFRKRAGYGEEIDNIRLEAILRQAMEKQAEDGTNFLSGRKDGEFVLRVAIPKQKPVYAVLAPAAKGKAYDYYVSTVITEEMYQSWGREGRLGSVGDRLETKNQQLPAIKPTVWLRYQNGDGSEHFDEYLVEDLDEAVQRLVKKGVRIKDIQAFQRIRLDIKVSLPGFTP